MDRAARHLRLLSETIAAVTSSLDLDEVTASVARAVARALEADGCFVYTYDEPSDELVLQGVYGTSLDLAAARPRMRPGVGLTGHAALIRAPVAVAEHARADPRFVAFTTLDEERFDSLLAVPILDRRDRLAGAMNVRTVGRRAWADDEIELIETIASQVAQAVENARLYDRSRRRVTELEALARISEAVSQSLYQEETLTKIVATTADAALASCCALVIDSPKGSRVAHRAGDRTLDDATLLAAAARAPVDEGSLVAVPLVWKTRTIGALVCTRSGGRPFSSEERTLLGSVAHQVATAVESGRGVMRELVAQEIHHRVKNNLQTVASLLRLRSASADPARALADSVDRVLSIAEVHDLLTASREGEVDVADLVRRLAAMLGHGLGTTPASSELAPIEVPGDTATAVALIFCELYANALEHGGGDVHVTLTSLGEDAELAVRDHGPGLPSAFDPGASLGLKIATALARDDLAGRLEIENANPGVLATVTWRRAR